MNIFYIDCILIFNKIKGLTSNQNLEILRKILKIKKIGHAGTLDPIAKGILPICLCEANKFNNNLLKSNKSYKVRIQLGILTDTGDSYGKIIKIFKIPTLNNINFKLILSLFIGNIKQIPPIFSALKFKNYSFYKIAYKNYNININLRYIYIYNIIILYLNCNLYFLDINIKCSKGTYIRSLIMEIGKFIGCGAHLTALYRFKIGSFDKKLMINLHKIKNLRNIL